MLLFAKNQIIFTLSLHPVHMLIVVVYRHSEEGSNNGWLATPEMNDDNYVKNKS